ncbi:LPXTG cell wall anchor domain-containing protein, partial [Kitasatospora kifunensis]
PTPTPTPTPTPSPSHDHGHGPHPVPSRSGQLPTTGQSETVPLLGLTGMLLLTGAGALLLGNRRRRGRHS